MKHQKISPFDVKEDTQDDFFGVEFDVLDQLQMGDTCMRMCQKVVRSKGKFIQLWSPLSQKWNTTYRYGDMDEIWKSWKTLSADPGFDRVQSKKRKRSVSK